MKYVVFDDGLNLTPILFPNWVKHIDIAFGLSMLGEPDSAGFVNIYNGQAACYGESTSLNRVVDGPRDEKLINRTLSQF